MKRVILIGGAPGTGKSTVAKHLSKEFDIPWISTDQLRGVVRDYASREKFPDLLLPEGYETAEKFLSHFSAQEIADMEYQQAYDVWPAVKYLVDEDYGWEKGVIIEGVNIIPELVTQDYANRSEVSAIYLIDEDMDRIKNVVYGRGIWDHADTYANDLKPKEVEWIKIFTDKLKDAIEKFKTTVIEVNKDESDFKKIMHALSK